MVFAVTPVCIVGVVLSVQPTFIFGGKQRLNTAGVIVAVFQVHAVLSGMSHANHVVAAACGELGALCFALARASQSIPGYFVVNSGMRSGLHEAVHP